MIMEFDLFGWGKIKISQVVQELSSIAATLKKHYFVDLG